MTVSTNATLSFIFRDGDCLTHLINSKLNNVWVVAIGCSSEMGLAPNFHAFSHFLLTSPLPCLAFGGMCDIILIPIILRAIRAVIGCFICDCVVLW